MTKFKKIKISSELITLGQLLKFADVISNGGEVKSYIAEHKIFVNGELCSKRGKKLREGDQIVIENSLFFEISKW